MASPQWKQNFQPPTQDSAILGYQRSFSFSKSSNNSMGSASNAGPSSTLREAGIIEKLLNSYGFIQCCERQARLFFHYSQFTGNIEHLKLGDAVEFEMTYDRRTGKPIASNVVKISPEALSREVVSEDRVSGVITTEIKNETEGRVAYENRGECFFLPYAKEDLDSPTAQLNPGDKVVFQISTDKCTGNLRARNVSLENPQPQRYQGVVCGLKETYGFIERSDVVKEIFFHSSECKDFKNLNLGDDVEFGVQTRKDKEVAVNVTCLPFGTVVFEDVSPEFIHGQIGKVIDRSQKQPEPLSGRIRYRRDNSPTLLNLCLRRDIEIQFGERDSHGDYTMQVGDWVQFNIATDRRDQLQRATHIDLLEESFIVSGEKREQGVIAAVKETFGFIKCSSRDTNLYFRYSELVNPEYMPKVQDEVEFTVAQEPSSPKSPQRYHAIRICQLPPGTVTFDNHHPTRIDATSTSATSKDEPHDPNKMLGIVEKEAPSHWTSRSPQKGSRGRVMSCSNGDATCDNATATPTSGEEGVISYTVDGGKESIHFQLKDCDFRYQPRAGDKVEFTIATNKVSNQQIATDVRVVSRVTRNGFRYTHRGFVAALKDSFGFIETEEHDRELFFHFSHYDGNPSALELGQEVEYGVSYKGSKQSAECVRKLNSGTIPTEEVRPEVLNGIVLRPVRCFNPDQDEYSGLIQTVAEGEETESSQEYPFGITSLVDKHDFLQKGDLVQFQVGVGKGQERAMNVNAIRTRLKATVEAIKGHYGFLSHEAEEGKKLFFHMSEVKGGVALQPGDRVEFVVMHNQRSGKYWACSVVKTGESQPLQRPERLISRLRTISLDDAGPRIVTLRQPRGPDGTNGFKTLRKPTGLFGNDEEDDDEAGEAPGGGSDGAEPNDDGQSPAESVSPSDGYD